MKRFLHATSPLLLLMLGPLAAGAAQSPFNGTPFQLPTTLQAEQYDLGLEGEAYHDTTAGNVFGVYRTDSMDVGAIPAGSGGGYHVGNLANGEWAEYTVNVPVTQSYEVKLRVASAYIGTATFHLELDGVNVSGSQTVTSTGGWQTYVEKIIPAISLTAGSSRVLRIAFDTGAFNLDWILIGQPPFGGGAPPSLPAQQVEAENYDLGGEGIAYHDTTAGNVFGAYRTDDVDVGAIPGGGHHVGFMADGEWTEYTVNVTQTAVYQLVVRLASANAATTRFRVLLDGQDVTGGQIVTSTGGWQTYINRNIPVGVIAAGNNRVLRFSFETGAFNFDRFQLQALSLYTGPLVRHPLNRRYFLGTNSTACKAVYLAGTEHRANVQDVGSNPYPPPQFDFAGAYPPAGAPLANFIRGWHWEHSRWIRTSGPQDWIFPLPFPRTGPGNANDGKPRFNLNQYDGGYISRLQSRASTAASENMVLSLMLFQGFSVQQLDPGEQNWPNHPFRWESGLPQNNVNSIDGDWVSPTPCTKANCEGAEMQTLVAGKPAAVTNAQDNYVRQMATSLNGYKNILWEVSNESNLSSLPWQNYIAGVIRSHEDTTANRHLVWISAPQGVTNLATFNSVGDVVSPSINQLAINASGAEIPQQAGWPFKGQPYHDDPPATSGSKIVVLDTDHLKATCLNAQGGVLTWCNRGWVWRLFT
ncbi:MAG: carbohydrate-binding protein, partial [Gammaproteobacteria bacterium]